MSATPCHLYYDLEVANQPLSDTSTRPSELTFNEVRATLRDQRSIAHSNAPIRLLHRIQHLLAFERGVAVGELESQNEDGEWQKQLGPVVVPARED